MASNTATLTVVGNRTSDLLLAPHETANIIVTRTGSGDFSVALEERLTGDQYGAARDAFTADTAGTSYLNATDFPKHLRLRCTTIAGNDSIAVTLEDTAGESLPGYPVQNEAGTTVFDVTDEGIETPLVTATTLGGTLSTAAQPNVTSLGTLTALQVDNLNINGNTISSTAGTDLLITPLAGQQIVLDGAVEVDAGVVTGVTSLTATTMIGDLNGLAGNYSTIPTATTRTVAANTQVAIFDSLTVDGTLTVDGELRVAAWPT